MMRCEKKLPLTERKCITKSKIHFELSKQRNGKKNKNVKVPELNVVSGDLKRSQNILEKDTHTAWPAVLSAPLANKITLDLQIHSKTTT